MVSATIWSINSSTIGLSIKIQSTRAPWFVEERVEAFLETFFEKHILHLTEAELQTQKEGLITKKLERAKNLNEETSRFWSKIRAGHYDFLRRASACPLTMHHKRFGLTEIHRRDGRGRDPSPHMPRYP